MKKVSPLLFVWLLFVVIGFVSCDDADGGGGVAQVAGQAPAPVPQTGQTRCWHSDGNNVYVVDCAGTGQDGDVQAGVEWPDPRFTDKDTPFTARSNRLPLNRDSLIDLR